METTLTLDNNPAETTKAQGGSGSPRPGWRGFSLVALVVVGLGTIWAWAVVQLVQLFVPSGGGVALSVGRAVSCSS